MSRLPSRAHGTLTRNTPSNARLEGLNGLFQAARARARGYHNTTSFATMIYLPRRPLGDLFQST
jgi:transposase